MEVMTYAEFNLWLKHFNHTLSEVVEAWGYRLVIGDEGIGLIDDDYEPETQKWLN